MPRPAPWEIVSPAVKPALAAAALLKEAYRTSGLRDPWAAPRRRLRGAEAEYAGWLAEALSRSELAGQLLRAAAGPLPQSLGALPDIRPALPWYARWTEPLLRPRSLRRLVGHVGYYLEWYALPGAAARPDLSIVRKAGPLACYYCLHWPVLAGIIIGMWIGGVLLTLAGAIAAILLVLLGLFNVTDILILPLILRGASPRQHLNRSALYIYLRDRLTETPGSGGAVS